MAKEEKAPEAEEIQAPAPRVRIVITGSFEIDLTSDGPYPGCSTADEAAAIDQSTYDMGEVGPEDVLSWIAEEGDFTVTFEGVE